MLYWEGKHLSFFASNCFLDLHLKRALDMKGLRGVNFLFLLGSVKGKCNSNKLIKISKKQEKATSVSSFSRTIFQEVKNKAWEKRSILSVLKILLGVVGKGCGLNPSNLKVDSKGKWSDISLISTLQLISLIHYDMLTRVCQFH